MTYFEEERSMVYIWLFITYGEIGDKVVKGVGFTCEVVNYINSPPPSPLDKLVKSWHHLSTLLRITESEGEIILS